MNKILLSIFAAALATMTTRALPYLLFAKKEIPPVIKKLGNFLPPAIMMTLVVYSLRSVNFSQKPYGLPEIISIIFVILFQKTFKNNLLSILFATVLYMILIRIM